MLGTFPPWLKRVPLSGLECEARKTGSKKTEKQVHLVFVFRLRVGFEPACFLRGLCVSSERRERVVNIYGDLC